jgi:CYTH domain-containing protein
MTDSASGVTSYKLGKKYGATGPYIVPIVNIYLDAAEYASLAALPAHPLSKRRYRHEHAGHVFSIDVFDGANAGLYLCEAEAPTLEVLLALTFPPFAVRDVTAEPGFSGWALAAAQSRA